MTQQETIVNDLQTTECRARSKGGNTCNLRQGHAGSHGIHIGDGFILAPWDGGFDVETAQVVDLVCDACKKAPMSITRHPNGASLSCSACHQEHFFGTDGKHTKISCTLWSSHPSPLAQRNQLRGRLEEYEWNQAARVLCGVLESVECERLVTKARADMKAEYERLTVLMLPWWRNFWRPSRGSTEPTP